MDRTAIEGEKRKAGSGIFAKTPFRSEVFLRHFGTGVKADRRFSYPSGSCDGGLDRSCVIRSGPTSRCEDAGAPA